MNVRYVFYCIVQMQVTAVTDVRTYIRMYVCVCAAG